MSDARITTDEKRLAMAEDFDRRLEANKLTYRTLKKKREAEKGRKLRSSEKIKVALSVGTMKEARAVRGAQSYKESYRAQRGRNHHLEAELVAAKRRIAELEQAAILRVARNQGPGAKRRRT